MSTPDPHADLEPDGRPYSELVLLCLGEGLVAPPPWDDDGIRRMWLEMDGLDAHDELCTPSCPTRRSHAQQLLAVAQFGRPRLTENQLEELAAKTWDALPQLRRQSLDQGDWWAGFIAGAKTMCDVEQNPGD